MACDHGCWEDVQAAQRERAAQVAAYNASLLAPTVPVEASVVPVEASEAVEAIQTAPEAEIATEEPVLEESAVEVEAEIFAPPAEEVVVVDEVVAPAEEDVAVEVPSSDDIPKAPRRK